MANPPFYVKATFEYQSGHDDDLNFHIGQVINVTEIEDDDWYVGEYTDAGGAKQDGLFPKNYVERCEPPAPPRPSRPRPKKDAAPAAEKEPAAVASTSPAAPPTPVAPTEPSPVEPKPTATEAPAPVPAPAPRAVPAAPKASPQPAPPVEQRAVPQKEEEAPPKPTGSFRDRIAAFNKPAAPPIAPKPSGASASTGFIKKPFVPPPPSRNAYVPPPRESVPPPKTYRREEDPEIAEAQAQAEKDAQDAGLAAPQAQDEEAEAPKATSLKDRIALLQRQQQEQAARRADATQKEKAPQAAPAAEEEPESHDEEEEPETVDSAPAPAPPKVPQAPPRIPPPETRRTAPESPEAHEPSDGNEADQSGAGDTTEDAGASSTEIEESEDRPRAPAPPSRTATGGLQDPVAKELEHEEAQEEEEDEMDEETRRKEELRARMAKMSGGMGMAGFFGPMPTMPAKKSSVSSDKRSATSPDARSPPPPPQRAPMVPVPGMGLPPRVQSPGTTEMSDAEESLAAPPVPSERPPVASRAAPPVPTGDRPLSEVRAPPPPPPVRPSQAEEEEDESDDEPTPLVEHQDMPIRGGRPTSYIDTDMPAPSSATSDKRASRMPPPIPGGPLSPTGLPEGRPPPPPPPHVSPPSTAPAAQEPPKPPGDYESDYEGDYDTDIASAAPHKDALKAHEREPSIDDGTLSEDISQASIPPPVPVHAPAPAMPAAQRAPPPPPPHQAPTRQSTDLPRAPPPAPPARPPTNTSSDDYDPYNYESLKKPARVPSDLVQESDPSLYAAPPPAAPPRPVPVRDVADIGPAAPSAVPQPPAEPPTATAPPPVSRRSVDVSRRSVDRRSTDLGGRPGEDAVIARDVDLAEASQWWTASNTLPPVFQGRSDILCEFEENTTSKRGGRTTVSKDIYILFRDYSQTVVSARYDPKDPMNSLSMEQRHELPPPRLSQEQLETASTQYGQAIAAAAQKASTVGDGSPLGLVTELIDAAAPNALKPIGNRAFGAVVYANMANSSVQQFDEIRPGDIVSFRNARFQGKHGPMHAKYSLDVGKPEHVAVVMEWDGTKKKIRAWEQGREKDRKVRVESFKVGDLRSGEVKVWRLVGREWVGWESNS